MKETDKTILGKIARETKGISYKTSRFEFQGIDMPLFDYEEDVEGIGNVGIWEDAPPKKYKNLYSLSQEMQKVGKSSIFKYFLDGSRRTYKVDDISYNNRLFPVIAGQICVGCCYRDKDKNIKPYYFKDNVPGYQRELLISLPDLAREREWSRGIDPFAPLIKDINELPKLKNRNIKFDKVLTYGTSKNDPIKIENRAIAKIQNYMVDQEKDLVAKLNKNGKLDPDSYLMKDGTLEYRTISLKDQRELRKFENNYRYVVGVSKSFNPEKCIDQRNKNFTQTIAELPLHSRTAVMKYSNPSIGNSNFAIWFVRIRESKYSSSPLDGILKLEILLTGSNVSTEVNSEIIDRITASIINESHPVCYGKDKRWANHLYAIYSTECLLKSKYYGTQMFLSLF